MIILILLLVFSDSFLFAQNETCSDKGVYVKILEAAGRPVFYVNNLDSTEWPIRYFKELNLIAGRYGIRAEEHIVIHDEDKPDRQICIERFMDSLISLKLGGSFRKRLIHEADSLFIATAHSKTIMYWACDSWPHSSDEPEDHYKTERTEPMAVVELPTSLKKHLPKDQYGNLPSFFLSFVIAKNGSLSAFKIENNMVYSAKSLSKSIESKLLAAARAEIMKGAPWIAGTIAGKPVNAEYHIKIDF